MLEQRLRIDLNFFNFVRHFRWNLVHYFILFLLNNRWCSLNGRCSLVPVVVVFFSFQLQPFSFLFLLQFCSFCSFFFLFLSPLFLQLIEPFLVFLLSFLSLEHSFKGLILQLDSEVFRHEGVENGRLVDVGVNKDSSKITDADFFHFLRCDPSRLVV